MVNVDPNQKLAESRKENATESSYKQTKKNLKKLDHVKKVFVSLFNLRNREG